MKKYRVVQYLWNWISYRPEVKTFWWRKDISVYDKFSEEEAMRAIELHKRFTKRDEERKEWIRLSKVRVKEFWEKVVYKE
jgi:hypothetical protein